MVRVRREGDKQDYPHLVERFRMRPAASDEPDSTLPLIQEMHVAPLDPTDWRPLDERVGQGPYPILHLLTDRAWSYKRPERWADPLRELRIRSSTCTTTITGCVTTRACASSLDAPTAQRCPTA